MKFTIEEIIEATKGTIIQNKFNFGKVSISTDTRTIKEGDIFLPLCGENFDGHDFINQGLKQGCIGYFIDKKHYEQRGVYYNPSKIIIAVNSTTEAYLQLANYVRNKIKPVVVAVTGSSGKTTVKEMIASVLASDYITHKSILNHNNEIGLCQTLISMPENTEFVVTEMGMRAPGEIETLSKYAEPDFAVITNIGSAHIGRLGSLENIAKAKCEIIKHLKKGGTLIAQDDKLIRKYCRRKINKIYFGNDYEILEMTENSVRFLYRGEEYKLPVSGEFNVINSLAAIEIAKIAEISHKKICAGLLSYEPVGERGRIINIDNKKIIADCYNANPDSMKAAIDSVISSYPDSKITLVLGEMAELGEYEEEFHREVGKFLSKKDFYQLITVGSKARLISDSVKNKKIKITACANNQEALEFLRKNLCDNSVTLLKGSRCAKLEEIAEALSRSKTNIA